MKRAKTSLRVEAGLWRRFKADCALRGLRMNMRLEAMIRKELGEEQTVTGRHEP